MNEDIKQIGQRLNTLFKTLMMDFVDEQARIMGAGKPNSSSSKLSSSVLRTRRPKNGLVKKRVKLSKPAHGLPKNPSAGL